MLASRSSQRRFLLISMFSIFASLECLRLNFRNYNVECMLRRELGVFIDKQALNYESMRAALHELLTNDRYTRAARSVSTMLQTRPKLLDARTTLVETIEYAAKNPHLNEALLLAAANMPLWKLFSLDVLAFYALILLVSAFAIIRILRVLFRLAHAHTSKQKRQ